MRSIIDECYERSRQILTENRAKMDEIVRVLLEKESLEREEFIALMEGAKAPQTAPPARRADRRRRPATASPPRRTPPQTAPRRPAEPAPGAGLNDTTAPCPGRTAGQGAGPPVRVQSPYGQQLPLPPFAPGPHPEFRSLPDLGGRPARRAARPALRPRRPSTPRWSWRPTCRSAPRKNCWPRLTTTSSPPTCRRSSARTSW